MIKKSNYWHKVFYATGMLFLLFVVVGCKEKKVEKHLQDNTSVIMEEYPQDTVIDKTFNDDFNFILFIDRIEQISEIDTFLKRNKNAISLLEKGNRDSSVFYIIKMGVDTKYRFQSVYSFYIDSASKKLFFLDVFNDSLVEIDSVQTCLP